MTFSIRSLTEAREPVRGVLALVLAAALLPGCAAARRGGENAVVVATFPVHIVTTPLGYFREDFRRDPNQAVGTFPILVPIYFAGDALFTGVAAVDAALTPLYVPFDVEPLRHFRMDSFPPRLEKERMKDAGEIAAEVLRGLVRSLGRGHFR